MKRPAISLLYWVGSLEVTYTTPLIIFHFINFSIEDYKLIAERRCAWNLMGSLKKFQSIWSSRLAAYREHIYEFLFLLYR